MEWKVTKENWNENNIESAVVFNEFEIKKSPPKLRHLGLPKDQSLNAH